MNEFDLGTTFNGIGGFGPGNPFPTQGPIQLVNLISTVISFLTIIAGLAFILYFVLGAIAWITSSGDQQKLDAAKGQMTSAAIGLIIVVASYAIIGIVGRVVGLDILFLYTDPVQTIDNISPASNL